ncbi:hypothetical protein GCM10023211_12960 [Orbus sasakiae]|uniref:Uncharacterized protein n=1 Tax=Orbus sasakiae TaxID=1078475 RepID=A0ABP9NAX1_9GAMM
MQNKDISQESEKTLSIKAFISNHLVTMISILILVAFCVAVYNYREIFGTEFSNDHSRWGEFGDFFGGFLGGISIIAVIYTLIIQQKQLKLQQTELKEQRNQQKLDSYERMVFWLIDSNQKILDEIYDLSVFKSLPVDMINSE